MRKEACPVLGKIYLKCKRQNHFSVKCSNSRKTVSSYEEKVVNKLENAGTEEDSDSELQIYTVKNFLSDHLREEQTVTENKTKVLHTLPNRQ